MSHSQGLVKDIVGVVLAGMFCLLCGPLDNAYAQAKLVPLSSWWSPSRGDNFASTAPQWVGQPGSQRWPDYRFVRIEGMIYNPALPAPPGTIPLYSWWSPLRSDNYITADPAWAGHRGSIRSPDYRFVRLEGYIHANPLAGTYPLQSFWSPSRGDNFASTNRYWTGYEFDQRDPDYILYRTEGYLLPTQTVQPPDLAQQFGYDTMQIYNTKATGRRPLLVILLDYQDVGFRHSLAYYEQLIFGPTGNVKNPTLSIAGFFGVNSGGKFMWENAGMLGPFTHPDDPATTMIDESLYNCANNLSPADPATGEDTPLCPGATWPWEQKLNRAVELAAAEGGFDFAAHDRNRDGKVTHDELGILIVDAQPPAMRDTDIHPFTSPNSGAARHLVGSCVRPSHSRVQICAKVTTVGESAGFDTIAHELAHLLGTFDLYGAGFRLNAQLTIMGATITGREDNHRHYHFDPWHKMRLGWIKPKVVPISSIVPGASTFLRAAQSPGYEPIIFYDPERGFHEYFIVEFRNPTFWDGGSDKHVADRGVTVWYVHTDKAHNPQHVMADWDNGGEDFAVFVLGAPDQQRGRSSLWRDEHGDIFLRWLDSTDSGLRLRIGPTWETAPGIDLEWISYDQAFLPRIDSVLIKGHTVPVGFSPSLKGVFGVDDGTRGAYLTKGKHRYEVPIIFWRANLVSVQIPYHVPAGNYQLRLYETLFPTDTSNAVPLTVTR